MQEGNCLVIAIEKKQTNNCVSKGLPVVVNRDCGGVLLPGLPVGLHGSAPAENDLNLVSLTHPERLWETNLHLRNMKAKKKENITISKTKTNVLY